MKKRMVLRNLIVIMSCLSIGAIGLIQSPVHAEVVTSVAVVPSQETVYGGEYILINITVDPSEAIAGMQTDLQFDTDYLTCNSVLEGNLFQ